MTEECQHPRIVVSESTRGPWRMTATCEDCGKSASDIAGWVAERKLRGLRTELNRGTKKGRP